MREYVKPLEIFPVKLGPQVFATRMEGGEKDMMIKKNAAVVPAISTTKTA